MGSPESQTEAVTVVIPGRNCAATIGPCLEALLPYVEAKQVSEIVFVDDGSTDDTPSIVREFPVRVVQGTGQGPGAARNLGWRAAETPLIWFIDSDCVTEPGALETLLPHFDDPKVAGVGGSYGNMRPDSLLACLIQEEIVERHHAMPSRVDFLATFNVIYRRPVLDEVGGFDERYLKAQDAELGWRIIEAGHELGFDMRSRVKHFHPMAWGSYLRTQRQQGFWRAWLLFEHRERSMSNSYSGSVDHLAPPLAMLTLASLLGVWLPFGWLATGGLATLVAALQIPMASRLVRRSGDLRLGTFVWMGFLRSFWRGVGLTQGVLARWLRTSRSEPATPTQSDSPA